MHPRITGARLEGATVELAREAAPAAWNVLAYEVELKSRRAKLTRKHFEEAVANHERYGRRTPVSLYHADTDPGAHPEARKAVGWIEALRVGTFTRKSGKTVASLEAQLRLNEATKKAVTSDPPELAYGSVTIVPEAVDEESGEKIGAYLVSFSLLNNPALAEIPPIQASDDSCDPQQKGTAMSQLMRLAAQHGIAAASEEEAEGKVIALAAEALDVRKVLGAASPADTAARLSALSADAAKVPGLVTELAAARKREDERCAAERTAHLGALLAAKPELAPVKASLELHAERDWAGFVKAYPLPSALELSQRSQDEARLDRVAQATAHAPAPAGAPRTGSAFAVHQAALELQAEAARRGQPVTYAQAVNWVLGAAPSDEESFYAEPMTAEGAQ